MCGAVFAKVRSRQAVEQTAPLPDLDEPYVPFSPPEAKGPNMWHTAAKIALVLIVGYFGMHYIRTRIIGAELSKKVAHMGELLTTDNPTRVADDNPLSQKVIVSGKRTNRAGDVESISEIRLPRHCCVL